MERLTVEYVPYKELKEYKHNAKEHPQEQVDQIAESIAVFGMNDPIAIDEDNTIIEGHGRLLAIKQLAKAGEYDGDTVPVIRLTHLTDQQKKAYILAHNKLTMNTGFDIDVLNDELATITEFDMADFGFADIEVDKPDPKDDNYTEPVPVEPKSKMGQIYQLGQHRLMVGDSTKAADVQALMAGELADLLLTDPPYNVDYAGKNKMLNKADNGNRIQDDIENDTMDDSAFSEFLHAAFLNASEAMRPGAAYYIWHAETVGDMFRREARESIGALREMIVWVKNNFVLCRQDYQWKHEPCLYGWKEGAAHYFTERRNETTVFEDVTDIHSMTKAQMEELLLRIFEETPTTVIHEDKPSVSDLHPTMKPIPLFGRLIKNSTQEGEIVLDLFAGSGTTVIAAEQLNRRAYMMEYDPRYADVIIDRWERFTGEQAQLLTE